MQKVELINLVSIKTGHDSKVIREVLEEVMTQIKNTVVHKEDVILREFGRFHLQERKEKVGRHIKENKPLVVPAHFVVKFTPGREFAKKVR